MKPHELDICRPLAVHYRAHQDTHHQLVKEGRTHLILGLGVLVCKFYILPRFYYPIARAERGYL